MGETIRARSAARRSGPGRRPAALAAALAWLCQACGPETPPEPAPPPAADAQAEAAPAEPAEPAAPQPAPAVSEPFRAALSALVGAVGPWTDVHARVWTEPDPVPDDGTYAVRFRAECGGCEALLFAIDAKRYQIALLYPNPYEPAEPLEAGAVRQVPSSAEHYSLRAVGGQGMDMLKLFVVRGDPGFPPTAFQSWAATPEEPERVAELAAFLEGLGARTFGTAEVPLRIAGPGGR